MPRTQTWLKREECVDLITVSQRGPDSGQILKCCVIIAPLGGSRKTVT
jgi:hypothetical protein